MKFASKCKMPSIIITLEPISLKPSEVSGKPNLGGRFVKFMARDDARHVYCIEIEKVANGSVAMPFRHAEFLLEYIKIYKPQLVEKLELICKFSQIRNHRLMRKNNFVISQYEGKKQFDLTPEMRELDNNTSELIYQATKIGLNPYLYLNEETDEDDVEQCTNSWCLNQNPHPGKASDNIIIITDLDKTDWLVLIERQNGPGRAQAAWAGGFVDKDETFYQAALREGDQETEITFESNTNYTTTIKELPVIKSKDWDPRAKFVEGMENGAVVTHHNFKRNYTIDTTTSFVDPVTKKFFESNTFERCPNVNSYGLNSWGTNSIIEFHGQIWKFVSFGIGSNYANYINKNGNVLHINLINHTYEDVFNLKVV